MGETLVDFIGHGRFLILRETVLGRKGRGK